MKPLCKNCVFSSVVGRSGYTKTICLYNPPNTSGRYNDSLRNGHPIVNPTDFCHHFATTFKKAKQK